MKVPFLDLQPENSRHKKNILDKFGRLIDAPDFILGKEVFNFEKKFAAYCGSKYAVGLNSGTDALFLALRACGVAGGDEVIIPAISYISTALAVIYCGARPVFVDVDEYGLIDAANIERAVTPKTKAILGVHLFGKSFEVDRVRAIAKLHKLYFIDDCAQCHGAKYKGKKIGSLADISCFSFYPTKNLGAWGDAGCITTNNPKLHRIVRMLRHYGESLKDYNTMIGYNSRLDTVQAIVLSQKLKYLDAMNARRFVAAKRYSQGLAGVGDIRILPLSKDISYYDFIIKTSYVKPLRAFLAKAGIATLIHYPRPLHLQPSLKFLGYKNGDLPVAEKHARTVMSLPFYPYIPKAHQDYVVTTIIKYFSQKD